MHDRVPAKPGQYQAVITASEFTKLQNGQSAVITMTRDDQPTQEGTPYNKASVLPDEVAALICPDVADPTPADAFAALLPLLGGTMKGVLGMGGNRITDLAMPSRKGDAVNRGYIDAFRAYSFSGSSPLDLLKDNWADVREGSFVIFGTVSGTAYVYIGLKASGSGDYGAALRFNYGADGLTLYRNANGTWYTHEH